MSDSEDYNTEHLAGNVRGVEKRSESMPLPTETCACSGRGDYYSEAATVDIPSPKLEPIPEASTELSASYNVMSQASLKEILDLRSTALTNRRATPYAATLLQDIVGASRTLTDISGRLSTPSHQSLSAVNDSMFESPLLAPMAPYGSPIRFNHSEGMVSSKCQMPLAAVEKSPVSIPLKKRLVIKRPSVLDESSPLKREEAKIRDMLWTPHARDDESAGADILPPEIKQLGPPSPCAVQSDKAIITTSNARLNKSSSNNALTVSPDNVHLPQPLTLREESCQPRHIGPLSKIPTMVGPNSLPYARCPSGIDSFAFDMHNPRPYDVIMPLERGHTLPKSVICDDKLIYRARNGLSALEQKANAPISLEINIKKPDRRDPSRPGDLDSYRRLNSITSTHNERARLRMERVKSATLKREHARVEEQNRREVAKITRMLVAEQRARNAMTASNTPPVADQHSQLNSRAIPFTPGSPQVPSFGQRILQDDGHTFPIGPAVYCDPFAHRNLGPVPGPTSTFVNIDEASQTQNGLLQNLQQRLQGIQLAPETQAGFCEVFNNRGRAYSQALSLPDHQSPEVFSAINAIMHTNQQLISMLQETEKLLISNGSAPALLQYAPPPLQSEIIRDQRFTAPRELVIHHASTDYGLPDVSRNSNMRQDASRVQGVYSPDAYISADPAVLSYTQGYDSVTFVTGASKRSPEAAGNLSESAIPYTLNRPLPALSRSVHELPPRPSSIQVSQKLPGILPMHNAGSPHEVSQTVLHPSKAADLASSTSARKPADVEACRQDRSNAPSPENLTAYKLSNGCKPKSRPLASLVPHKTSQPKQQNALNSQFKRRSLAKASADRSGSSADSEKGSNRHPNGATKRPRIAPVKMLPIPYGLAFRILAATMRISGQPSFDRWAVFHNLRVGGKAPCQLADL